MRKICSCCREASDKKCSRIQKKNTEFYEFSFPFGVRHKNEKNWTLEKYISQSLDISIIFYQIIFSARFLKRLQKASKLYIPSPPESYCASSSLRFPLQLVLVFVFAAPFSPVPSQAVWSARPILLYKIDWLSSRLRSLSPDQIEVLPARLVDLGASAAVGQLSKLEIYSGPRDQLVGISPPQSEPANSGRKRKFFHPLMQMIEKGYKIVFIPMLTPYRYFISAADVSIVQK